MLGKAVSRQGRRCTHALAVPCCPAGCCTELQLANCHLTPAQSRAFGVASKIPVWVMMERAHGARPPCWAKYSSEEQCWGRWGSWKSSSTSTTPLRTRQCPLLLPNPDPGTVRCPWLEVLHLQAFLIRTHPGKGLLLAAGQWCCLHPADWEISICRVFLNHPQSSSAKPVWLLHLHYCTTLGNHFPPFIHFFHLHFT